MATIIDSLIVTLGLNNGPYIKSAKEAEAQQKKFRDSTKKTGNDVSDALAGVGKAAAGIFLGFESLKGAISFFAGLTVQTANLGRFAKNVGEGAHELNAWDNAAELAGGSAADAEADIRNLSSSITSLKATGEVSSLLLLFQRLGVAIYDSQGKTRKLTDIYKDAGDKLKAFNRADAANLAKNAGISDTTLNLIIAQADERQRLLDLGEKNAAVDEKAVEQAQEMQEAWRGIGQQVKSVGTTILTDFAGPVKEAFSWVSKLFASAGQSKLLQQAFSILGGLIHSVVDVVKLAFNGLELLGHTKIVQWVLSLGSKLLGLTANLQTSLNDSLDDRVKAAQDATRGPLEQPKSDDRKGVIQRGNNSVNNNPGNLRFAGQAGATAGANGFAAFPTLAAGIQAANRQLDLYAQRGVNTISKIVSKWAPASENDTASYIADLEKKLGIGRDKELSGADRQKLLQAIFGHEGRTKVSAAQIAGALGPNANALATATFANQQTPTGAAKTGGGSTNSTNVQIDQVNVHTQATDADGVAGALPGALKRKGVVAQADQGMK
jgi:hypothetical protein